MTQASPDVPRPQGAMDYLNRFGKWCAENPLAGVLLGVIALTLIYFFGFLHIFVNGRLAAARWAWEAWNPEMNQEHSKLVPLIFLGLIIYHRDNILRAPKQRSDKGMIFVGIGILFFILAARCLQPRMAITAVPFLIYGSVLFLWGEKVARVVLFPCVFLIFMIPVAAVEQATFKLQFVITGLVGFLANLIGIQIQAVGTTLSAADGSFNFEIAEGCSGIRSLTAMTMLTAVFVHLTQDRLWKKVVIFGGSLVFAIIGNAGRIFTVILVAKFFNPTVAGGIYHHYSGYVFFPFAVITMLGFSKLVNLNVHELTAPEGKDGGGEASKRKTVSYDY